MSPGRELSFRNIPNANFEHRKRVALASHDDLLFLAKVVDKVERIMGLSCATSRVF